MPEYDVRQRNMTTSQTPWFTGVLEHEGLPLHLRFPEAVDFDAVSVKFPTLVTVTHNLDEVAANGEPTSAYNDSLEDFDGSMVDLFRASGHIVLVETFSGRRTYYGYIGSEDSIGEGRARIQAIYPEHSLEWEFSSDKSWRFIKGYSKDYNFYEPNAEQDTAGQSATAEYRLTGAPCSGCQSMTFCENDRITLGGAETGSVGLLSPFPRRSMEESCLRSEKGGIGDSRRFSIH